MAKAPESGGSFAWWQKQAKRATQGLPVQTYRRAMVG